MKDVFLASLEIQLHSHEIRFLYIGSYALALYHPEKLHSFTPPDIDLLIEGSNQNILLCIQELHHRGAIVEIWGQRDVVSWTEEFLKGKWYVRIYHEQLIIDLSFEYPYLDFEESWNNRISQHQHMLAHLDDVWFLKCLKDTDKAFSFAQEYALEIPDICMSRKKKWLMKQ